MSSAQSVPSIEVGASWLGGCEQVRTAGALELLVALHRTFGPRRAERPESLAVRDAELAGRHCPIFWPGRWRWGRATGGRPRWPRSGRSPGRDPRPRPIARWSSTHWTVARRWSWPTSRTATRRCLATWSPGSLISATRLDDGTDGARRIPRRQGCRGNGQRHHRHPVSSRPRSRWWTPTPFGPLSRRQVRLSARRRRCPGHRAVRPAGRGHDAGAHGRAHASHAHRASARRTGPRRAGRMPPR
jgi:hypothetical protein